MRIADVCLPPVVNASGTCGFVGEGYWFHSLLKPIGLTFKGCGFASKTTTIDPLTGNMPLKADGITPREWKPHCIIIRPRQQIALNAVGLSGPGAPHLLGLDKWQRRRDPFIISCMAISETLTDQLAELGEFVRLFDVGDYRNWRAPFVIELNISCPNVGLDPSSLINKAGQQLDVLACLGVPIQVKLNVLTPIAAAVEIARHPACYALVMGNTIPWGQCSHWVPWKPLFGTEVSPLAEFGGGGLSGWPLLHLHCEWIKEARESGIDLPIWGCGGILKPDHALLYYNAGASSVQLGSIAFLAPWNMPGAIRAAYQLFD